MVLLGGWRSRWSPLGVEVGCQWKSFGICAVQYFLKRSRREASSKMRKPIDTIVSNLKSNLKLRSNQNEEL